MFQGSNIVFKGLKFLQSQPQNIFGLTAQSQNFLVYWGAQHAPIHFTLNLFLRCEMEAAST